MPLYTSPPIAQWFRLRTVNHRVLSAGTAWQAGDLKILLSAERGQSAARGRGQLRKAGRAQSSPPNSVVHRPWVRDREKDTLELRQNQQQCLPHRGKVLLLNLQSKQSFPSCSLQPAKSQGRKHRDRRKHNGNANHVSISLDGMCKWTGRAPVTSN